MEEWNSAVDKYMRAEGCFRDAFDVEYKAKIGLDGGPLYKTCDAEGCYRIEKRDVATLMRCSGCSLVRFHLPICERLAESTQALYCSKECQKSSWKDHRKPCKAGTV